MSHSGFVGPGEILNVEFGPYIITNMGGPCNVDTVPGNSSSWRFSTGLRVDFITAHSILAIKIEHQRQMLTVHGLLCRAIEQPTKLIATNVLPGTRFTIREDGTDSPVVFGISSTKNIYTYNLPQWASQSI
ncbi:MAG: hypothetical protein WC069_03370 [Candidatus Shapirobacteria bacterium]